MPRQNTPLSNIQQPARRAASHPWVEKLARFGFAAKGIVYFIVGLLAAQAALGTGGQTTDTSGALTTIVNQPFGKFLLALVTIGLIGYALWRFVQAIFDPEHQGARTEAKHIAQRIGYGLSAIAYSGLALTAIKLILGNPSNGGDSTRDWTARFMGQPFGRWLVGLAGLAVIGVGLSYLYQAYKAKFQRHFNLQLMSEGERRWTKRLGQFGIAARGVVFSIIGLFLMLAALNENANEARGLGGALAALAAQPFGPWLLGIVALGLIAYSIYSLIEARYRQIQQP
ncbi:DUF1206 domain-containing protein [Leptolyngbya ohadii]|uniref:DUF1206 domain-containing protein n=1 Tax=Leptolyngbya ohadii TaxID=1962290 RepID=UPI000B598A71|nr:DUF1206 domain-containing protein [Leptolyngbya ohadii]